MEGPRDVEQLVAAASGGKAEIKAQKLPGIQRYDPVAQTAYISVETETGTRDIQARYLYKPEGSVFVVAVFPQGEWEIPTLTQLPTRWGGGPPALKVPQSRSRTKRKSPMDKTQNQHPVKKKPACAPSCTAPPQSNPSSCHLGTEIKSDAYQIGDATLTVANKMDRGMLWVIMHSTGGRKCQLMQITAARIGAEFPAVDASEYDRIGRHVMIKVAASMQALGEVVTDKRMQQDMRDTALLKIKR